MPPPGDPHQRFRRSMWAMVAYLAGFAVLITFIAWYYLIPAMDAARNATPGQRQQLSAYSLLLMAIILLIVFVGIVLTFRVSRFFFPRPPHAPPARTKYVDAWAESAKRFDVDEDDERAPRQP
jgi:heme/copper-type cytochrome/quinol oxidase subunit 2